MTAIQTVDDPERCDEHLRALGRDHRKFRVQPEHYDVVGVSLIESLRAFAGERWSVEYDQAWRDAYSEIAARMMQAAVEDDTSPPFWHAEVGAHERRSLRPLLSRSPYLALRLP